MLKFRKRPVVIEAFQMTKERRWDNSEWPEWLNRAWNAEHGEGAMWPDPDAPIREGNKSADRLVLGTLEGVHRISWGDYIIQGVKGELYPCKPDIFEQTYEAVDGDCDANDKAFADLAVELSDMIQRVDCTDKTAASSGGIKAVLRSQLEELVRLRAQDKAKRAETKD